MQGPGVINNSTNPLINNSHLPAPSHPINSQWAALNTNPDLQQTLCQAAAAGYLTQEQLQLFGAYMKNSVPYQESSATLCTMRLIGFIFLCLNVSASGTSTSKGQQATSESLIETPSPAKELLQQLTTPSKKI
ncbi:hypothetical protein BY996DRAFT_8684823 [Phakopsora pachyrhizi]|nr:hypothetical protein BY996DRAFT_8684823 [Phakopsora pachyrhizi]